MPATDASAAKRCGGHTNARDSRFSLLIPSYFYISRSTSSSAVCPSDSFLCEGSAALGDETGKTVHRLQLKTCEKVKGHDHVCTHVTVISISSPLSWTCVCHTWSKLSATVFFSVRRQTIHKWSINDSLEVPPKAAIHMHIKKEIHRSNKNSLHIRYNRLLCVFK